MRRPRPKVGVRRVREQLNRVVPTADNAPGRDRRPAARGELAPSDAVIARRMARDTRSEGVSETGEQQQHDGKRAGIAEIGRHVFLHVEIRMSVVQTLIFPGKPTSAGTSNASIERPTMSNATARNAATPAASDAHHRAQNTGAAHARGLLVFGIVLGKHRRQQRKASGDHRNPSTRIMPDMNRR